jgi:signal peptidase I
MFDRHVSPRLGITRFVVGVVCLAGVSVLGFLTLWATVIPLTQQWSPVAVISGSMAPAIQEGDIVLTQPPDLDKLGTGAVIVFDNPAAEGRITHRIIDKTPTGDFVTIGDANRRIDSTPVPPETIHGVGRILVPYIGQPFVWVNNGQWVTLAIATALLLAALWASRWALLDQFDPWQTNNPIGGTQIRPGQQLGYRTAVAVMAVMAVATVSTVGASSQALFADQTNNTGNSWTIDTLNPPTALTATSGATVTLDWTATADTYAGGHRIYRATNPGGPYVQIAEVTPRTTVTYVDNPAVGTYYYTARAFTLSWESADSNQDPARPFACPVDPDLRSCIRFDDDVAGTYLDDSGYSNTVIHTNGTLVPGISDAAAYGAPTALYEMADSASLDLTSAMTIEMWIRLDSQPSSGRVGILDNDGQYSLMVYATTGLRCSNGLDNLPNVPVPTGVWFHIACAWDGSTLTLYIDGLPVATMPSTGTISTTNTDPVSLLNSSPAFVEPMDGAMDNLRIWHSGRTQAQICADAGLTGC